MAKSFTKSLPSTGERFIPEKNNGAIAMEHLQRYRTITSLVKGRKVLDAACGAGYGSAILAASARDVTGIDISKEAIAYDSERYQHLSNLRFIEASIEKLPFANASFDVVVSFETIEHVAQSVQEKFLREIKRCLKPNGILIMSSPDKKTYSDLPKQQNPYHIHEFYFDEFQTFLKQAFADVRLYRQGVCSGHVRYLKDQECLAGRPLMCASNLDGRAADELYMIAVCGDALSGVPSLNSVFLYPRYESTGCPLIGGVYAVENTILPELSCVKGVYTARFSFADICPEGKFRFDPLEGQAAIVTILEMETDARDYCILPLNAERSKGNTYTFYTCDPILEIAGDFSSATYFTITYTIEEVSSGVLCVELSCLRDENALVAAKKRLETELQAMRRSTSWKITAPLRKLKRLLRREKETIYQ